MPGDGKSDANLSVEEYKTLREEMLTYYKQQHQLITLAVLSTGAILGVGLQKQNPEIFLIPLIIIVPIMWRNGTLWNAVFRISTYISVFIEPQYNEMRWHKGAFFEHFTLFDTNTKNGLLILFFEAIGTATSIYTALLAICLYLATTTWKHSPYIIYIIDAFAILVIVLNIYLCSDRHRKRTVSQYRQKLTKLKGNMEEQNSGNMPK